MWIYGFSGGLYLYSWPAGRRDVHIARAVGLDRKSSPFFSFFDLSFKGGFGSDPIVVYEGLYLLVSRLLLASRLGVSLDGDQSIGH